MKKIIILLLISIIIFYYFPTKCQTNQKPELTFTLFSQGFVRPVEIINCGDSRLFIVQEQGKISIVDSLGNINPTPFLDITKKVNSKDDEEGLLGLAFSPDYKNNGQFYVHYTNYKGPSGNIVISRFRRSSSNPDIADTTEEKLLEVWHPYTNHNGGDLAFGPDGYLYMGFGDGGSGGDSGNRAQSLDTLLGKMLRIDVSKPGPYGIPATNPFINTPNARPEIWAYGLRNPWRWSFDRLTHDLWIADVGQNLWEEVDFQPAGDKGGENYGWHCWEGLVKYSACNPTDVTFPFYTYDHSASNCAVTGGYVYRGAQYGDLFGRYLLTDYCSGRFMSIRPNGTGGWIIDTLTTTPAASVNDYSTFGEDKYGELYIAGNTSGKIWKIGTTSCTPTAFITNPSPVLSCGPVTLNAVPGSTKDLTFKWKLNNNDLPGATAGAYRASENGTYTVIVTKASCSATSQAVSVVVDDCAGINNLTNDFLVSVYPNPVNANFYIDITQQQSSIVDIEIRDLYGRIYVTTHKYLNQGFNHLTQNLESIPQGIYFLILYDNRQQIIKKFIVSK